MGLPLAASGLGRPAAAGLEGDFGLGIGLPALPQVTVEAAVTALLPPATAVAPIPPPARRGARAGAGTPAKLAYAELSAVCQRSVASLQRRQGRRVKEVPLDATELWGLVAPRLLGLAAVQHGILRHRGGRRACKAWALGAARFLLRKRAAARRAAVCFAVGEAAGALCRRAARVWATKVAALAVALRGEAVRDAEAAAARRAAARARAARNAAGPKMARLHWTPVEEGAKVKGSIFDRSGRRMSVASTPRRGRRRVSTLLGTTYIAGAAEQFKLATPGKGRASARGAGRTKSRASALVSFLPAGASRNLSIALARALAAMPAPAVAEALLAMDVAAFPDADVLEALAGLEVYSAADAIASVKAFEGPVHHLDIPERFIAQVVAPVPAAQLRLQVLQFAASVDAAVAACKERLAAATAACLELRRSEALADLLGVLLRVANTIQTAGGAKDNAVSGFRVTSLATLLNSRGPGGVTVGVFLVQGLLEASPALLDVRAELPTVVGMRAAAAGTDVVDVHLATLRLGAAKCRSLAPSLQGSATTVNERLLQETEQHLQALGAAQKELAGQVALTCKFFLEDPRQVQLPALISGVQSFLAALHKTQEEVLAKQARKRRSGSPASVAVARPRSASTGGGLAAIAEGAPPPPPAAAARPAPPPRPRARRGSIAMQGTAGEVKVLGGQGGRRPTLQQRSSMREALSEFLQLRAGEWGHGSRNQAAPRTHCQ